MDDAKLLTAAVEQSSEGIAVTDLAGSFIFINQAFADMHRYQPEELIGKHMSTCHGTQDMMSLVAARRYIVQAGEFSGRDASSEERWDLFSRPVTGIPGPRRRRQPSSNLDSAPKHSRHQED